MCVHSLNINICKLRMTKYDCNKLEVARLIALLLYDVHIIYYTNGLVA